MNIRLVFCIAFVIASGPVLSHSDHGREPVHFYFYNNEQFATADAVCKSIAEDVSYLSFEYSEPAGYTEGTVEKPQHTCVMRYSFDGSLVQYGGIAEDHCLPTDKSEGGFCQFDYSNVCASWAGMHLDYHSTDDMVSPLNPVNVDFCRLRQHTIDQLTAWPDNKWNQVQSSCEYHKPESERPNFDCLASNTFAGVNTDFIDPCFIQEFTLLGGTNWDTWDGGPLDRIASGCDVATLDTFNCPVGQQAFVSYELPAGYEGDAFDGRPDSACRDFCSYEPWQPEGCSGDQNNGYYCEWTYQSDGGVCSAAEGGTIGPNVGTGGDTSGGDPDGGSGDGSNSGGGTLDDSRIVAGLDGIEGRLDGIEGELQGIGDTVDQLGEALDGDFETGVGGLGDDDLGVQELAEAQQALFEKADDLVSAYGLGGNLTLSGASYVCGSGVNVQGLTIRTCFNSDAIQALEMLGTITVLTASISALRIILG